ncbi:helix-turn-helix transcriptional regulator [Cognatishimia sp. WU-CL00825]
MSLILQKWTHVATKTDRALILPDGCRDLILWERPDAAPVWRLSALQAAPETAALQKGTKLTGFRLAPGVQVPQALLYALPKDAAGAEADISGAVMAAGDAMATIAVLKNAPSVGAGAKILGVSVRSLHRRMLRDTGFAPIFWLRLARVRRAALRLGEPFADLAADSGFSDQAHMTREFQRWFGMSPRGLRGSLDLRTQLHQPALATGEQISIR